MWMQAWWSSRLLPAVSCIWPHARLWGCLDPCRSVQAAEACVMGVQSPVS